jgi:hypothetical protein
MVVVVLLGVGLIIYGKAHRANANTTPPLANAQNDPSGNGHWHAAYAFYVCDKEVPFIQVETPNDLNGIPVGLHTHGDGIIHIHPFSTASSGSNAKLGKFAETAGWKITDTTLEIPEGKYKNGDTCTVNGKKEKAKVKVAVWETRNAAKPVIYTSGFKNIRFTANEMLITIGFVPDGVDLPKPKSEPTLNALTDLGTTTSTTVPGTGTTVPGTGTTVPGTGTTVPGTGTTVPVSGTTATTTAASSTTAGSTSTSGG